MQLEALKVFCDLASSRSFSKAAAANGCKQPAVSRIVQELEKRLGVLLIDRSCRPLQLTPLGQVYYEGCKSLLEQYLELESSLQHAHTQLARSLRVAAIYSVGLGDIRQLVERFEAQNADVRVHLDFLHPDQVYERVLAGADEVGLVSYPRGSRELTVLPWREEEMVVACSPRHRLASLPSVRPEHLDGEAFVAFDPALVIRREVDRFLRNHGVTVRVALEFDNIENIKKGIEVGAGLALLPAPMLRQEVEAGTLRALRLEGCCLVRPLGIIHRRHGRLGSAAQKFIELLRAHGNAPPVNGDSTSPHPRPRRKRTVS